MDPTVKNIYYNFLCLPKNPKNRKIRVVDKWFIDIIQIGLYEREDLIIPRHVEYTGYKPGG